MRLDHGLLVTGEDANPAVSSKYLSVAPLTVIPVPEVVVAVEVRRRVYDAKSDVRGFLAGGALVLSSLPLAGPTVSSSGTLAASLVDTVVLPSAVQHLSASRIIVSVNTDKEPRYSLRPTYSHMTHITVDQI